MHVENDKRFHLVYLLSFYYTEEEAGNNENISDNVYKNPLFLHEGRIFEKKNCSL